MNLPTIDIKRELAMADHKADLVRTRAIVKIDSQEPSYEIKDRTGKSKRISQNAVLKIEKMVEEYEESIILQALALTRNKEYILESDIIAAKNMIEKKKGEDWKHKLAYITAGPLATFSIHGIINQLFFLSTINPLFVLGYITVGIIATILFVWGLFTETR